MYKKKEMKKRNDKSFKTFKVHPAKLLLGDFFFKAKLVFIDWAKIHRVRSFWRVKNKARP